LTESTRLHYQEELEQLEERALGGLDLVTATLNRTLEAVEQSDVELAEQVVADDDQIDGRYLEVHQSILALLATQGPVATDLRLISALLHLMKSVERMGDQCVNIAKVIPLTGHEPPGDEQMLDDIATMGRQVRSLISQAKAAFGDGGVYLERCILRPRHVEFQIFGDKHGRIMHLGERDCSIQRRHQKLLEEAPSPALTPELRAEMGATAVKLAQAAGYTNAGTVEFLLDQKGNYYFMEMNTRLQVEHPVTEMVTFVDLVDAQIRIAAGERLHLKQEDIQIRGWSFEARINAEDPLRGFMPDMGKLMRYLPPAGGGVRLDSCAYEGYRIPSQYDSMIGKLITFGSALDGLGVPLHPGAKRYYEERGVTLIESEPTLEVAPEPEAAPKTEPEADQPLVKKSE